MKAKSLTASPKPIRIGPATAANIETIIASGIASNTSAAFRAAAAALARAMVADPRVWVISISGFEAKIFATRTAAVAWLGSQDAREQNNGEWAVFDEDDDPETWYSLDSIVLQ